LIQPLTLTFRNKKVFVSLQFNIMKVYTYLLILFLVLLNILSLHSQQIADSLYIPSISSKIYPNQDGTIVYIDEGHNNFHTKEGRYSSFANLLRLDGYQVESYNSTFNEKKLKEVDILVIANALPDSISNPITIPTESAFSKNELSVLKNWVKKGGSLFLIADHMPFAGAAFELAKEFGFEFYDSFVMYSSEEGIIDFEKNKGTLSDNFITKGRSLNENVSQIRSYTGQGFKLPNNAMSILNLDESQTVYLVDTMWVFNDKIDQFPAKNLSQGAVMNIEKGKIAIFGEAAMFTAQLAGSDRTKVGMNTKEAEENHQLLLNIIHWLDDKLEN